MKRLTKNQILLFVISLILAVSLVVISVFGILYGLGYADNSGELSESQDEAAASSVIINEGVSSGKLSIGQSRNTIRTSTGTTTSGDVVEYSDDTITLTAEYDAIISNPTFTWTSSNSTAITLTPSSDTISCEVTCNSAFSSQITITCTSNENTSLSATCTVDYVKRLSTSSTFFFSFYNYSTYLSSYYQDYGYYATLANSTGYAGSQKITVLLPAWSSNVSFSYALASSYGTGTVYESYTYTVTLLSYMRSDYSIDVSSYYIGTFLSCYAIPGLFNSSINAASSPGDKMYSYWSSAACMYDLKLSYTITGDITGETHSGQFLIKLDMSNYE